RAMGEALDDCENRRRGLGQELSRNRAGREMQKAPMRRMGAFALAVLAIVKDRAAGSARGGRAPALMISLARLRAVGRRADFDLELDLLVALDGRLLGAAVLLAPDEGELRAGLRILFLDEA